MTEVLTPTRPAEALSQDEKQDIKDFLAKYSGKPLQVQRPDGRIENGWRLAQLDTLAGGQEVVVYKQEEDVQLTKHVPRALFESWNTGPVEATNNDFFDGSPTPADTTLEPQANWREQLLPAEKNIQASRDEWEKDFPAKPYLTPEGPTIGPEDVMRLEAEAEAYDFDSYRRNDIVASYEAIRKAEVDQENALRAKLETDNYPSHIMEAMLADGRKEAAEKQLKEEIETWCPFPENGRRQDMKKVKAEREKLAAILTKDRQDFVLLQADWEAYESIESAKERDQLQNEALTDDKKLKSKEQRSRLKSELAEINTRNGGVLKSLAEFPLEKDARVTEVVKDFKDRLARHKGDEDLLKADRLLAFHDLKWRLGEVIAAANSNLSEAEVTQRSEEAAESLQDWLDSMESSNNDPMKDLEDYKNKSRAYELWDSRHREVVESLAPVVMMNNVERKFVGLGEKLRNKLASASEALKAVLDPNFIGERNGGHALRHTESISERDTRVFLAGIRGQLSQALLFSRHEGTMMKAAVVLNSFARGGAEDLSTAWDRLSPAEKTKLFRKEMAGKAAVGMRLGRLMAANAAKRLKDEAKYQAGYFYLAEK